MFGACVHLLSNSLNSLQTAKSRDKEKLSERIMTHQVFHTLPRVQQGPIIIKGRPFTVMAVWSRAYRLYVHSNAITMSVLLHTYCGPTSFGLQTQQSRLATRITLNT